MVVLSDIVAANQALGASFPKGLTAVFVGGTSGVGEYTLKALTKYVPTPRIYLIGRSQDAADRIIKECQALRPNGHYEFMQADVSSLKSVDAVCTQIKDRVKGINLLFLTQGTMAFGKTTADGLPMATMLATHSRLRFILDLGPLIQRAHGLKRVVNVGAGSYEGAIDTNNLHGADLPLVQWRGQTSAVMTLLLQEASRRYPDISFINNTPGVVKSNITRDAEGFSLLLAIGISKLLAPLIQTPPEECAERQLFQATDARYPARSPDAITPVAGARGSETVGVDGVVGSGAYSIDTKCESASAKVMELVKSFGKDGTAERVWQSYMKDFKKITGSEAM